MRNNILKIISILTLALSYGQAHAQEWRFTHSFVNAELNYLGTTSKPGQDPIGGKCGSPTSEDGGSDNYTCCERLENGQCASPSTIKVNYTIVRSRVPLVNETCFRPSCYYHAAQAGLLYPMPVQPLTRDTSVILKAIGAANATDGIQSNKLKSEMAFVYQVNATINGEDKVLGSNDLSLQNANVGLDNWGVSAGTSAMQGLLWSWRMLTDQWRGVWKTQSDFETNGVAASERLNLPATKDSKNIILISDGLDTDGEEYNKSPDQHPLIKNPTPETGIFDVGTQNGIGFIIPRKPNTPVNLFETCDAHVPLASITDADYASACSAMKSEGIIVHVILYNYDSASPTNKRLYDCAANTGGVFISDANPQNILDSLKKVFASIASHQIRLVK